MTILKISEALREDITQTIESIFGNNGTLRLYSSPKPDTVDDPVPVGANLLATFSLGADTFPDGIDEETGTLTTGAIADATVTANGEATWARIYTATSNAIMDMNVTASEVEDGGSLGTITLSEPVLVAGQTISCDPLVFNVETNYST
jgi:hypothetical protein